MKHSFDKEFEYSRIALDGINFIIEFDDFRFFRFASKQMKISNYVTSLLLQHLFGLSHILLASRCF